MASYSAAAHQTINRAAFQLPPHPSSFTSIRLRARGRLQRSSPFSRLAKCRPMLRGSVAYKEWNWCGRWELNPHSLSGTGT